MRTKRRLNRILVALPLLGGALLLWGCLSDVKVHGIRSAHRSALHGIHAEKMHDEMGAIEKNYRKAHRLPIRLMRERGFQKMEHCAERIAVLAASLPAEADLTGLSAAEIAIFKTLAAQLKINAETLEAAAARRDRAQVREGFARMTSTCNACHAAFRPSSDYAGHGET